MPARPWRERSLTGLLTTGEAPWLKTFQDRAEARALKFQPMTVADRFEGFQRIHYWPWGVFMPDDPEGVEAVRARLVEIGNIPDEDSRIAAYRAFQDETEGWETQGAPGHWTGPQGIARSSARFRIAGFGRRSGKTFHAAREGLVVALLRPRSTIWVAAPVMRLVSRGFDMIDELIADLHVPTVLRRNGKDEKLIVLENGSRIEGMSLDNIFNAAGASVDFAIVDEAAQIVPDAWHRAIAPPLADKQGQALLISSYEGEEGWFYEQTRKAKAEGLTSWEAFHGESWDNFYAFPQGRKSPAILEEARSMDPQDFLEQFGAIPMHQRHLVYREFKSPVHLGDYPFNPKHPVRLAVDPSGGANEYAVAVLQDYERGCGAHDNCLHMIDEYYVAGVLADDVIAWCWRQPWAENVQDVILDSALPSEVERWVRGKFTAFYVEDKPQPEERFPILKRLLRDPLRYYPFYRRKLAELLDADGKTLDAFERLEPPEQRRLTLALEESLADVNLFERPADVAALRACARFFVDKRCVSVADEFRRYAYTRRKLYHHNLPERARAWKDHLLDALGYYVWHYHRSAYEQALEHNSMPYLLVDDPYSRVPQRLVDAAQLHAEPEPTPLADLQTRGNRYRDYLRDRYRGPQQGQSYLING